MKKTLLSIVILVFIGTVLYVVIENKPKNTEPISNNISDTEYIQYKNSEYDPEFTYPKSWGNVTIKQGNKTCPEEDTYRTADTLHIFDREFSFPEMKLPNSESFIRSGIRTYQLDAKNLNTCGDDFHMKIATKEIDPGALSSFKITPISTQSGLTGTYNQNASRLNTEGRIQYTFFIEQPPSTYIIQSYISFIPVFGSPELNELENQFSGDMQKYIAEGKTAEIIRRYIGEFKKVSESLKLSVE